MAATVEPGGRQPAPGALALVQQLINTRDVESGQDELRSPERLRAWLIERDLAGGDVTVDEESLGRFLALREALRAALRANHGERAEDGAMAALNARTGAAPLQVTFDEEGRPSLRPAAGGVDGALASLLAIVMSASIEGTWPRLKVCPSDSCQWAFYDHSKNHSGTWCSMAVCGNRSKVRAYQRRRSAMPA